MQSIKKALVVPHTTEQMFNLVNAIEDYPSFLPWCESSEIHSRDEDEVRASLVLHAAGIRKSFTTVNRLQSNKMIEIILLNGPFKHLEGFWRFDEVEDGQSRVALDLEFEMAGGIFDFAFGPIFHQVANTLVDSFVQRANDVYS